MNEPQKPFTCTINGCQMTFTDEDHLNWHHKKHDMVLNLEIDNKDNAVADQTPTPTRFIRNCEEVGLFQDLQNVNPFDETFKKAFESVKSGTLHIPDTNTDDTLHTPHIFPHVEETVNQYTETRNHIQSNQSDDFCIANVSPINGGNVLEENSSIKTVNITTTNDNNNQISNSDNCTIILSTLDGKTIFEQTKNNLIHVQDDGLRRKLKEVIINKDKNKQCTNIRQIIISPPQNENENLILKSKRNLNNNTSSKIDENNKKFKLNNNEDNKVKIREMNRAAQLRCRRRKQIQWKKMEHENQLLKLDNKKLFIENQNLKHKLATLQEILLTHKNCNLMSADKIAEVLQSMVEENDKIKKLPSTHTITSLSQRPIQPMLAKVNQKNNLIPLKQIVPIAPNNVQKTKPMLIQIVGSPQLALSVSVLPQ